MRPWLAIAVLSFSLDAAAAPASEESVARLLDATRSEAMMDSMYAGMEQMMRQGMAQAAREKPPTPEQQRVFDALPARFVAVMREEMNWTHLKPMYVQLYRETFDQEEIDGLLAFYASPAGRAFTNKMPVVMQKSMMLSQSLIQSLIPKMTAAMKEAVEEAKTAR